MADLVKLIFAKPIHLAIQVVRISQEAWIYKWECHKLEEKTVTLLVLLRQAAKASSDLSERPTRLIIEDTNRLLEKAHALVLKCRSFGLLKLVFTVIPVYSFTKMLAQYDKSIGDVVWLLRDLASIDLRVILHTNFPRARKDRPILYEIWALSFTVCNGSIIERSDAAEKLGSIARSSDESRKMIIEEGGVAPLLKLVKDGNPEGQANAATAIGSLGRDPEDAEHLIHAGVCSLFADILKEGHMEVQAVVAWAVSELAGNYPKCQHLFAQHDIICQLVSHLAFETTVDQEHSTFVIPSDATTEGRKSEVAPTKTTMKAMAARALWRLAVDNSAICRCITESRAMSCFAVLLERGTKEEQYNSAMALMEITAMVEKDTDMGRSAFQLNSPTRLAVVDQLLNIIEKGESHSELLIPCVKSIGNLARTCRATETRMILPLVRLLEDSTAETSKEVSFVLSKTVCHENYLCIDHSKAILSAGAVKHLIQLAYFGEQFVQIPALILLSYISLHVPDNEELTNNEALCVIEWAEHQVFAQNHTLMKLLQEAKSELELYQ